MTRTDPQINVRQSPDRYAILEAAAFVEAKGTPGKLVQEIVDEAIDRFSSLPAVKKALGARSDHESENAGKLTPISQDRVRGPNSARPGA